MSQKEREALKVLDKITQKSMTVQEAATVLHKSERQVYRILARYRSEGDAGLIHRLRGKPSNRGYDDRLRTQVLDIYSRKYADYGPTLFTEKLEEYYGITIDPETARRWLSAGSFWNGERAPRRHRKHRPRRSAFGELLQFDGSDHAWFEGRGPICTLLTFIDDASNHSFMRFVPSENTRDVLQTTWEYVERLGRPVSIYLDRHAVYYSEKTPTDFMRACAALGIEILYAHSPQAKGRIERSNRTHQDRLLKALREQHITTISEANAFLDDIYLDKHNRKFAHTEGLVDVHRSVEGYDLKNILCFETTRVVNNDDTIRLDSRYYQLMKSSSPLPPPHHSITVRRWLDDSLHIFWKEHELNYRIIEERTSKPKRANHVPKETHPWRMKPPIGKAKHKTMEQLCREW